MNSQPKFITGEELARICCVSPRTVEGWRIRGRGPKFIKLPSGLIRYPLKEVLEFVESYRHKESSI